MATRKTTVAAKALASTALAVVPLAVALPEFAVFGFKSKALSDAIGDRIRSILNDTAALAVASLDFRRGAMAYALTKKFELDGDGLASADRILAKSEKERTPTEQKIYRAAQVMWSGHKGRADAKTNPKAGKPGVKKAKSKALAVAAEKVVKGAKSYADVQAFALAIAASVKSFVEGSTETAIKLARNDLVKCQALMEALALRQN